jgi:hypothetical protein
MEFELFATKANVQELKVSLEQQSAEHVVAQHHFESYLYTFMRIAGCEKIIQWGFDETAIDGQGTLNQWAMLMDRAGAGDDLKHPTTIVTLECAAVLPGSEAEEIIAHMEQVWERGKMAVDYLRHQLGPDLRDKLCPLTNGGVSLHKIVGVMHDTCNCSNKVAPSTHTNPLHSPLTLFHTTLRLPNLCKNCAIGKVVRIMATTYGQLLTSKHARVLISCVEITRAICLSFDLTRYHGSRRLALQLLM